MYTIAFPGGSVVKQFACNAGTWAKSLGQEDPLERGTATHSKILAWRMSWTEEPGRLQSMGSQRIKHDWAVNTHSYAHTHTHTLVIVYILVLAYYMYYISYISYLHFTFQFFNVFESISILVFRLTFNSAL